MTQDATWSSSEVEAHYAQQGLEEAIFQALRMMGKDLDRLTTEDLAPVDEFHIRGRKATFELARKLKLVGTMQVLDVGSGLGGPSRLLAQEFGCRVTGLDLSEEYCRTAATLARHLGLDSRVAYRQGNALEMPFRDASFDVVWTQHASMNVPDKFSLFQEMYRVLKPGGLVAVYDICAGSGGEVHFPVPWAREPAASFLAAPNQMRSAIEGAGFEIDHWSDTTELGRFWFRKAVERLLRDGAMPLGLHLLFGETFLEMAQNQLSNLEEGRIALVEVIGRRPAI